MILVFSSKTLLLNDADLRDGMHRARGLISLVAATLSLWMLTPAVADSCTSAKGTDTACVPTPAVADSCTTAEGTEAIKLCSEVLAEYREAGAVRAVALRMRARAFIGLGQYRDAMRDYGEVLYSGFGTSDDHYEKGLAQLWSDDPQGALDQFELALMGDPSRPEYLLAKAQAQTSLRHWAAAADTFKKLEMAIPNDPQVQASKGWLLFMTGEPEKAIINYSMALSSDENNVSYWQERGYIYETVGDLKRAERDYTKALSLDARNANTLLRRGVVLFRLGLAESALHDLEQSLVSSPSGSTRLERANVFVGVGDLDAAEKDLALARKAAHDLSAAGVIEARILHLRGRTNEAREVLNALIGSNPNDGNALYWRAKINYQIGELQDAELGFSAYLELYPRDLDAYLDRALVRSDLRRTSNALADIDFAIDLDPDHAGAYATRAKILYSSYSPTKALASCRKALTLDQNNYEALRQCAWSAWELNKLDDSLGYYDAMLRLQRNDVNALAQRAGLLVDLGRAKDAVELAEKAVRLDPQSATAFRWRGYVREATGELQSARTDFNRAVELDPSNGWMREARAFFLLRQGPAAGALDECQAMWDLMPDEPGAAACLARVSRELEDSETALDAYNRVIASHPNYGPAHYERGRLLIALGYWEEARASFTAAIALDYRVEESLVWRGDALRNLYNLIGAQRDYLSAQEIAQGDLARVAAKRANSLQGRLPRKFDENMPKSRVRN